MLRDFCLCPSPGSYFRRQRNGTRPREKYDALSPQDASGGRANISRVKFRCIIVTLKYFKLNCDICDIFPPKHLPTYEVFQSYKSADHGLVSSYLLTDYRLTRPRRRKPVVYREDKSTLEIGRLYLLILPTAIRTILIYRAIKHVRDTVVLYGITNIGNRWDCITIFHTGCIRRLHYRKTSIISIGSSIIGIVYIKYAVTLNIYIRSDVKHFDRKSCIHVCALEGDVRPNLDIPSHISVYSRGIFSQNVSPATLFNINRFCTEYTRSVREIWITPL